MNLDVTIVGNYKMKKTLIKQKDIKNGDVPMVSIRWFEDESSKEKTVVIDYFHNNGEVLSSTSFEWTKDEIKELMELL
jgi:hypothetical protein